MKRLGVQFANGTHAVTPLPTDEDVEMAAQLCCRTPGWGHTRGSALHAHVGPCTGPLVGCTLLDKCVGCTCWMHVLDTHVGCMHWVHALDAHVGCTRRMHVLDSVLDARVGCMCYTHVLDTQWMPMAVLGLQDTAARGVTGPWLRRDA